MSTAEISPAELNQSIKNGTPPVILDVREDHELAIASLPSVQCSLHIPIGEIQPRLHELSAYKHMDIVVYCRSGSRSGSVAIFLQQNGFSKVKNLKGGILAWSQQVDPTVRQY